MNKKMKRWIVTTLFLGCAALVGIRIYHINKDLKVGKDVIFEKGEEVEFGENFTQNSLECINGYTVKVLDSELITTEEYYEKYLKLPPVSNSMEKHYYIVRVEFQNKSCEKGTSVGINLPMMPLLGLNYQMSVSYDTFSQANPNIPSLGFSLESGTSIEVVLPYPIFYHAEQNLESMKKIPPMLQITEYPERRLLKIE